MTILVTGAAGYLGNQTVKRLVADGRPTRALVRHKAKAALRLKEVANQIEIVEGDVTRPASLTPALAGVDWRDSLCRDCDGEGRADLRVGQLSGHGQFAESGPIRPASNASSI